MHPCAQQNSAKPIIIVNHPVLKNLSGDILKATRVVLAEQLQEWRDERLIKEVAPELLQARQVASKNYSGHRSIDLNKVQQTHKDQTIRTLDSENPVAWHICTGYGKTVLGLSIIANQLGQIKNNDCVVIAVPRLALAAQWRRVARSYREFNEVGIEIFGTYDSRQPMAVDSKLDDDRTDPESDQIWDTSGTTDTDELFETLKKFKKKIVISTYQSLPKLIKNSESSLSIRLFLADEVHRSGKFFKGQKNKTEWSKLRSRDKTALIVASATMPLTILNQLTLSNATCRLTLDEALNSPEYRAIMVEGADSRLCDVYGLVRLAKTNKPLDDMAEFLVKTLPETVRKVGLHDKKSPIKILVFCNSISSAIVVRDVLRKKAKSGFVEAVSSSRATSEDEHSPQVHLRAVLRDFNATEIKLSFITNADLLTEGVDIPTCNAVAVLSPRSYATLTQIMGRAVRASPKKKAGVIAFYGNLQRTDDLKEPVEKYRKRISEIIGCAYKIYQVVQGTGNSGELPTGRRSSNLIVLSEDGPLTQTGLEALEVELNKLKKEIGLTKLFEPEDISLIKQKYAMIEILKNKGLKSLTSGELKHRYYNYRRSDPLFRSKADALIPSQMNFEDARQFARSLSLKSNNEWRLYLAGKIKGKKSLPENLPRAPDRAYPKGIWTSWSDFLGTKNLSVNREFRPFKSAQEFVHGLGLRSGEEWRLWCKGEIKNLPVKPDDIPTNPQQVYESDGWKSWPNWLGTEGETVAPNSFWPFKKAREYVRKLGLAGIDDWRTYCQGKKPIEIPKSPWRVYANSGWRSLPDWLGYDSPDRKFANKPIGKKITNTAGLLSAEQFSCAVGVSTVKIARMIREAQLMPFGYLPFSTKGVRYFFRKNQVKSLRNQLGLIGTVPKKYVTIMSIAKKIGVGHATVRKVASRIKLEPVATILTTGGVTGVFLPSATEILRKEIGVSSGSLDGFLNMTDSAREIGLSQTVVIRLIKKLKLRPKKFRITNGGRIGLYSPTQRAQIWKASGITLKDTTGLLTMKQLAESLKIHYRAIESFIRVKGIRPMGIGLSRGGATKFYNPRQIPRNKVLANRGITLENTKGLIDTNELARRAGVSQPLINKYIREKLITPAGKAVCKGGIGYFFKPSTAAHIRRIMKTLKAEVGSKISRTKLLKKKAHR